MAGGASLSSPNIHELQINWLPVNEVIYMSADVCFLLLMGLRSIQPYAPHWVLCQLGRHQIVPHDENLSAQVIELRPRDAFQEEKVR